MRLAEARRRTGYSARRFAKATNSSTRPIWELEKGRRLPEPRTVRKFAEVLAVPAGDVEEFREAIRRRASRGAPPEVLVQIEQMEVDLVDTPVVRIAAQRSLRELMQYLVRSGHAEDVDEVYREVREGMAERGEASIGCDTES
jgi:transcriptional regulator with XRE-family HTH domain